MSEFKIPKVVEHFQSLQGEGTRAGRSCIFIRFFGCTLPGCPGFGQKDPCDKSTWKTPELRMDKSPEFGCDSPKSWHPPFEKFCKGYDTVEDLYADTIGKYDLKHRNEVIITGGEPMLWQEFLIKFMQICYANGTDNFTIETNGMIGPSQQMLDWISDTPVNMLFSLSPKLQCVAGVDEKVSIRIDNLKKYLTVAVASKNINCQFKYVVNGDQRAVDKIFEIHDKILEGTDNSAMWEKELRTRTLLMPVGAWDHSQEFKQKVAQMCIDNGFCYCPRLHVDIWGSAVGV